MSDTLVVTHAVDKAERQVFLVDWVDNDGTPHGTEFMLSMHEDEDGRKALLLSIEGPCRLSVSSLMVPS